MNGHRRRAFSFVQLLVVIAIIAILLAILIPAVRKARVASRIAGCKAQLANIAGSMQIYLSNNKGWYPPARWMPAPIDSGPLPGKPSVAEFLRPHVGNAMDVFRCPADDAEDGYFKVYGISYSYYAELGETRVPATFIGKFERTRDVVLLWDAERFHGGNRPWNYLYTDGHVEDFHSNPKGKILVGQQAKWK